MGHTEMTDIIKKRIATLWLLFLAFSIVGVLFATVPLQIIGGFFLIMIMGFLVLLFVASIVWAVNQVAF